MDSERAKPLALDTPMWTASCTKLMTSISALQLVDRGLVTLDEPLSKHLPELDALSVIASLDEAGKATEEKQNKPITLRMLLSHSSGLDYDFWSPTLTKYLTTLGKPMGSGGKVLQRFGSNPLVFQPGESFTYGPGIDFAGLLVERITGQRLEEYMRANIWNPIGMKDVTFYLSQHPDMDEKLADVSLRTEGKAVPFKAKMFQEDGKEFEDCMGGMGSFTSAGEYVKLLKAMLVDDKEEKLLKKATWDELFKPQLSPGGIKGINTSLKVDMVSKEITLRFPLTPHKQSKI